ncbi:hypothetical protein C0J52_08964 [Blattella germanica]|nr:hypothetical protein C0J52_08964 [Blattella germanica]
MKTMTETRYTTALAHLISAGASMWALKVTKTGSCATNLPFGGFGSFLINSALGVLTFGNPEHGSKLKGVYRHSLFLCQCLGLPCLAAQLCMNYHVQMELAYLQMAFSLVPLELKEGGLILTFHH